MPGKIHPLQEFNHPDLSPFAIHFTGRQGTRTPDVPKEISDLSASDRLERIVLERGIGAYPMFQTPDPVACFTECTRVAVEKLIRGRRYEPIGIAFRKNTLFQRGGGPALYVRGDAFHVVESLPNEIRALCTRFWPGEDYDNAKWTGHDNFLHSRSEWIHEREWRVLGEGDPPSFRFTYDDVAFLLLRDQTGRDALRAAVKATHPALARTFARIPVVFSSERGEIDDPRRAWIQ